ncbi:MAG: DUF4239 domain-containing protein [Candidatus Eremiobacteraeota bacterium]|nr:DUF4239 domain-containing protein [Candidatus Eremiobacteraeota bacterium]
MNALYAVPSWLLLFVAIVVAGGLAAGGQLAVRRAFPRVDFEQFNTVSGIVLGVVGALFAVTVAFIIAIVWQEFDATSQRSAHEVAAALDLWHVSRGFPQPLGGELRRDLVGYADLLVNDEWPKMRTGESSASAEALLTKAYEGVARFRPANAGESNAQALGLQYFGALHDARHQRLDDNTSAISPFEWAILWIGAVVVVGLCYLAGMPNVRTQLVMTAAVGAVIVAMFVLIFELDQPYRGDLSVAPSAWSDFAGRHRAAL